MTKWHRSISAFISFPASVVALGSDPFFRPCHHSLNEWMASSLRNLCSSWFRILLFGLGSLRNLYRCLHAPSLSRSSGLELLFCPTLLGKQPNSGLDRLVIYITLSPRRLSFSAPSPFVKTAWDSSSFLTRVGTRHPPLADLFLWSFLEEQNRILSFKDHCHLTNWIWTNIKLRK